MDWYPDPADATRDRYWDGERWTHNTRPAQPRPQAPVAASSGFEANAAPPQGSWPQQGEAPQQPGAQQDSAAQPGYGPYQGGQPQHQIQPAQGAGQPYGQQPYGAPGAQQPGNGSWVPGQPYPAAQSGQAATTADAVPLSGWWRRVFAFLVDGIVTSALLCLFGWKWVKQLVDGYTAYFNDMMAQTQAGTPPTMPANTNDLLVKYNMEGALTPLSAISWAVALVYFLLLWRFLGASLGQLLMGIRVVPTDNGRAPRQLGWVPALVRALVFSAVSALPILPLISYLMPLGTKRRQTLHDMAARTQVVRSR
ncbi:hypothetical protein GCM10009599_16530 [Luteococcus peritonei]